MDTTASPQLDPAVREAALRLNPTDLVEALGFRLHLDRDLHLRQLSIELEAQRAELAARLAERDDLVLTAAHGTADLDQVTASVDSEIQRLEQRIAAIQAEIASPPPAKVKLPDADEPLILDIGGGSDFSRMQENPFVARELRLAQRKAAPLVDAADLRHRAGERVMRIGPLQRLVARPILALLLGLTLLAVAFIWPSGNQPSDQWQAATVFATPAPLPATPTLPPASPTPAHGATAAPSRLIVSLGTVDLDLAIIPADWQPLDALHRAIFPAPTPPLGEGDTLLVHYGAYPGEGGNMVLLGAMPTFSTAVQRLQINDPIIVTSRNGQRYGYKVTACDSSGARYCSVAKEDVWPLGHTPKSTLTLIAAPSAVANIVLRAVYVGPLSDH